MSVVNVVLFYSKFDKKSLKMKKIIDELNVDVQCVSVDNNEIKELLLNDDKYNIDSVPSVVILYSTGVYKVYTDDNLTEWFETLIENVKQQYTQQEPIIQPEPEPSHEGITSLLDEPNVQLTPFQQSIASQHIVGASNIEITSPPLQTGTKEIKQEGMSAQELAKQMAEQRDRMDESVKPHPF